MKLLLDTHVWLWMLTAPDRLSKTAQELVMDEGNRLCLSAASGWEISIKCPASAYPALAPASGTATALSGAPSFANS